MRGPAEGREQTVVVVGEGHRVVGLARSEDGAAAPKAAPAEVHRGSLDDPDGLARAAAEAEGVIHLAAIPSGTHAHAAGFADPCAIEAMGSALAGSGRPFVVTPGTLIAAAGRLGTEARQFGRGHRRAADRAGRMGHAGGKHLARPPERLAPRAPVPDDRLAPWTNA
ncbi:NAD-dependent epimerase/dehydratase family protein [Streptomyces sp. NPDC001709]